LILCNAYAHKGQVAMKKYRWLVLTVVVLFPVLIYVYCEYKLHGIALEYAPNDIPQMYFYNHSPRFNRALWIYYTDDQEFRIKKVSLWRALYEFLSKRRVGGRNSDDIVYMASRMLIAESKKHNLRPLDWQITWLAVSEWISRNWDIDQCLSLLSNRTYFGDGCFGIAEASKVYFAKTPEELNTDEICMLIATTWSHTQYDPRKKNEKFIRKTNEIKSVILQSKNWK
jgi:membrane carboxypeptidase/penicillin-binding protein PbpC